MRAAAVLPLVVIGLAVALPTQGQPVTLVTVGDSLTAGDGDDGVGGGYPARLLALLEPDHPGSTLNNLAVSGHTSDDLINVQLDPAVAALEAAPAGSRAVALLWIGSNDLFGLYNWVCDSEYGNDYSACEAAQFGYFSDNLGSILTALTGTGADVFVALLDDQSRRPVMTDPALRTASFDQISAEDVQRMSAQVTIYNDEITARAATLGLTTVDFFSTTIFEDWDTLDSDGNHPNGAGYDAIASIWYQALAGGTPLAYRLTVTLDGSGSGSVTSSPPGIDCGAGCSHEFAAGSQVSLSPSAAPGSSFAGWGGACSGTGSCVVTMTANRTVRATFQGTAGLDHVYTVPVVIHGPGAAGTSWRSSVVCVNRSADPASLELRLGSEIRTASVPAGATREWPDIVVGLFGASPSDSTADALHIAADEPLLITSRTFNQGGSGTFGQYLPALVAEDLLSGTDRGCLPSLKGIGFRTNVGFVNPQSSACTVRLTLHDANGGVLGRTVDTTIQPGEWVQRNDVFALVGAAAQELAYAVVEIPSGVGSFWAYASVVDADTGDATTVPVLRE